MKLYSIQVIAFAMNLYKKKFKKSSIFSILCVFEANQTWKKALDGEINNYEIIFNSKLCICNEFV